MMQLIQSLSATMVVICPRNNKVVLQTASIDTLVNCQEGTYPSGNKMAQGMGLLRKSHMST
jgi:hypothetical protein